MVEKPDSLSVNPADYGLPARNRLAALERDHLAIVVDRKSRIIMKDGQALLKKSLQIKETDSALKVSLMTSAPVCSKTRAFLEAHDMAVLPLAT